MFIVKLWAGFANQMFQYALYRSLKDKGKNAFVDTGSFTPNWDFEDISIEDIFPNLKVENANPMLITMFNKRREDFTGKVIMKFKELLKYKYDNYTFYIKEPSFAFNSYLFDLDGDYYLDGFWQSESYFENIADTLRKDFQFVPFKDEKNKSFESYIKDINSVCVHVRKGLDYKKSITTDTCGVDYYKRAIKYIKDKVDSPKFIVCSDNIPWCKENLGFCDREYVDWNPSAGYGNHYDMQLMAQCKHNIIANSSYSWWGAWLNNNPSKVVIGPKDWFNWKYCSIDTKDLIPNSWIKL